MIPFLIFSQLNCKIYLLLTKLFVVMVKFLTAVLLFVSTIVVVHSAPACSCNDDPPPPGDNKKQFTCAQQKKFGKCNVDFMLRFCECTCNRCPDLGGGCPSGQVGISGQRGCESVKCAQKRQSCASTCGGQTLIKFDCKDVTDGGSSAFSSSCACV
eukprot:TRINITY_DN277_c2_g1_i3.p3 TRINITY_DN277_c2_g1~~TRINITY_DN277_c2_g1_i3.p3  ORF type:complete len:156 (+),score=18.02 TRINITY_DN277_c2_g1_i3:80-547(+)